MIGGFRQVIQNEGAGALLTAADLAGLLPPGAPGATLFAPAREAAMMPTTSPPARLSAPFLCQTPLTPLATPLAILLAVLRTYHR